MLEAYALGLEADALHRPEEVAENRSRIATLRVQFDTRRMLWATNLGRSSVVDTLVGDVAPRSITFDTATGKVEVRAVGKAAAIVSDEVAALKTTEVPAKAFVIDDALF